MKDQLIEKILNHQLFYCLVFIVIVFSVRAIALVLIKRKMTSDVMDEHQRRMVWRVKQYTFIVLIIGVFLIWLPDIKHFALSIAAFAVAIVLTFKELILCLTGSIWRTTTDAFTVGDWIEIDNVFGEVIDNDWFSTSIAEISPASGSYKCTGTTVNVPNSLFLSHQIKNLNFKRRFIFHEFDLSFESTVNPLPLKEQLEKIVDAHMADHHELAKRYHAHIRKHIGVSILELEPKISLKTTNLGDFVIHLRLFCPVHDSFGLQEKITEDILKLHFQNSEATSSMISNNN